MSNTSKANSVHVLQVAENLHTLAASRAGDGPSAGTAQYDPELLTVMIDGAECIEQLVQAIDRAAIACHQQESRIARDILLESLQIAPSGASNVDQKPKYDFNTVMQFAKAYAGLAYSVQEQMDSILDGDLEETNPNAIKLIRKELGGLTVELDHALDGEDPTPASPKP